MPKDAAKTRKTITKAYRGTKKKQEERLREEIMHIDSSRRAKSPIEVVQEKKERGWEKLSTL